MKKTATFILALMFALFVCLSVCVAEDSENTGAVQKYGDIGRLSKLNITEDELNEVLKDIMVNSICNRYVFYDTMTDMLMALHRGDIVVLETDQNTVRYIASRNDNIVDRPPYMNPNMLIFCMLLRGEDAELRDQISACIAEMKEDGTIEAMQQTYIEDVIAGEEPGAIELQTFPDAKTIKVAVTGDRGLCEWIKDILPGVAVVPVIEGVGSGSVSIHPNLAVKRIREAVEWAAKGDYAGNLFPMPEYFELEVRWREHSRARGASFYPGCHQVGPYTAVYESSDWMDVLKFIHWVL